MIEKLNWIIRTEQSRTITTNWTPIDRKNNQENFAWTLNNGVMRHPHTIALRKLALWTLKYNLHKQRFTKKRSTRYEANYTWIVSGVTKQTLTLEYGISAANCRWH